MLKNSTFHPYEFAFCGFSGSGKTTLVEKLIKYAGEKKYKIGVVKHDAHHFEMDIDGKDTFRFRKAGAKDVLISNKEKSCLQSSGEINSFSYKQYLIDNDFVLVEGHKLSKLPKLVFLSDEIIEMYQNNELFEVKGFITSEDSFSFETDLPIFHRDDVEAIFNFVLNQFQCAPLKILILAGGKSQRMGEDKGKLNYHGDFQTKSLFHLLKRYSKDVYISIRAEQESHDHVLGLPIIKDVFPIQGPSSGILSAMNEDPCAAWMVIAIDLPYLTEQTIEQLLKQRNPLKNATCFKNPERGWPEPLCTIWEPKSRLKLHQFMAIDSNCPRKILFNSEIELLELENKNALDNCNTHDEYLQAKKYFEVQA